MLPVLLVLIVSAVFLTHQTNKSHAICISPCSTAPVFYDCSPVPGKATICIDPTTGYGPVVLIYNTAGKVVWSSGVTSACVTYSNTFVQKIGDYTNDIGYGNDPVVGRAIFWGAEGSSLNLIPGCNNINVTAQAIMPQATYNALRWVANSNGVNVAKAAH